MENKKDETLEERLLVIVKTKRSEIEKLDKPSWLTNCSFPMGGSNINIHTIADPVKLVELYSYVISMENSFSEASIDLGWKEALKINGYTSDQWKSDFKTRFDKLRIKIKEDELADYEARLIALSPEMKKRLELEEIERKLNS